MIISDPYNIDLVTHHETFADPSTISSKRTCTMSVIHYAGLGWDTSHLPFILNESNFNDTQQSRRTANDNVAYDVVIQRVSHPWFQKVNKAELTDSIRLAEKHLSAKVVIYVTGHMNNNVRTVEEWDTLRKMNRDVRRFVKDYNSDRHHRKPGQIRYVLVADVERYADELFRYNAMELGYNSSDDHQIVADKLNGHLQPPHAPWKISMCCAERVKPGAPNCIRNNLFNDGLHLCMDTVGFRIEAVLACLIDCAYNSSEDETTLRHCERACNDRFMSLRPIPDNEIVTA